MARSFEEINAARAATLLRYQRVREDARKIEAARGRHEHVAAVTRERAAREAFREGKTAAEKNIATAEQAVHARTIDRLRLETLLSTERESLAAVTALAVAVEAAVEGIVSARTRLDAANAALLSERQMTRKKERIAESANAAWRLAVDTAQELEREDQFADTRRAG